MVKRTLLVILIATIAASCTYSPPPGTGDPGNVRLHTLDRQSLFHVLPPGATLTKPITLSPAYWSRNWGGWSGPAVTVTFQSDQSIESVYTFYANKAAATGWKIDNHGVYGLVDTWSKTLPDRVPADVTLVCLGVNTATGANSSAGSCTLNGSMSAKLS